MSSRIPKFRSREEERQFWLTHDITDFWGELAPVRVRFRTPRRMQTVRLTTIELHLLHGLLAKLTTAKRLAAHARKS